jgi:hypothetical protein
MIHDYDKQETGKQLRTQKYIYIQDIRVYFFHIICEMYVKDETAVLNDLGKDKKPTECEKQMQRDF